MYGKQRRPQGRCQVRVARRDALVGRVETVHVGAEIGDEGRLGGGQRTTESRMTSKYFPTSKRSREIGKISRYPNRYDSL